MLSPDHCATDEFEWSRSDAVVVRRADAIAVYPNNEGDVVIRRQADWNEEDDPVIIVPSASVVALCRAILLNAGSRYVVAHCDDVADGMIGPVDPGFHNKHGPMHGTASQPGRYSIDWQAAHEDFDAFEEGQADRGDNVTSAENGPKDRTAAERAKRYRERHKGKRDDRDAAVTHRQSNIIKRRNWRSCADQGRICVGRPRATWLRVLEGSAR